MNKLYVQLSYAWHLSQGAFHSLWPSSNIPQFILDTQNPWLKDNQRWLERLKDPQSALCDLDSRFRPGNGDVPADLFSYLEIDNNMWGVERAGWRNAEARLKEILKCPAALEDAQELKVGIYVHHDKYSSIMYFESITPPPELPNLFIKTFQSMANLSSLTWDTFGTGNDAFRDAFVNSKLELPTIKHLRPAQAMECFVTFCPNLEWLEAGKYRLENGDYRIDYALELVESASNAKNLSRFTMQRDWSIDHLETAFRTMPNVSTLEIGDLAGVSHYGPFDHPEGDTLGAYLDVLVLFEKLKHLRLPSVWNFDVDFHILPTCGNAYFGPEGRAYGRELMVMEAEKVENTAPKVLSRLPDLESLVFGCRRANLTKDENGRPNATWPWTGRMKEWTYERWPE